jgi:hypothetical protein
MHVLQLVLAFATVHEIELSLEHLPEVGQISQTLLALDVVQEHVPDVQGHVPVGVGDGVVGVVGVVGAGVDGGGDGIVHVVAVQEEREQLWSVQTLQTGFASVDVQVQALLLSGHKHEP